MKQRLLLPPFNTVAANGTATLSTSVLANKTITALHFVIGGGNTKANMTRIQVRYNKKDIVNQLTGTQLQTINTWKGLQSATTDLVLHLGNPEMKDFHGKHLGALDTSLHKADDGSNGTLEIQVDLGAGASPTLSCYAEVLPPKIHLGYTPEDALLSKIYKRTLMSLPNAVPHANQDVGLAASAKSGILHEFWFHTNLTSLQVDKDSVIKSQDVPVAQMQAWQADLGHTGTTGLYVYSPTEEGHVKTLVSTLKDDGSGNVASFAHYVTTSAADTINVQSEVVANFDNY